MERFSLVAPADSSVETGVRLPQDLRPVVLVDERVHRCRVLGGVRRGPCSLPCPWAGLGPESIAVVRAQRFRWRLCHGVLRFCQLVCWCCTAPVGSVERKAMVVQVQAEGTRSARGCVVHVSEGLHRCQRRRQGSGAVGWPELEPRCAPREQPRELLNTQCHASTAFCCRMRCPGFRGGF